MTRWRIRRTRSAINARGWRTNSSPHQLQTWPKIQNRERNREILLHVSPAEILKTWPGVTGGTSLHSCELLHIQNLDNNHQYEESTTWLCLSHLWFQNSSHWWIWWPDHIRCCAALEWAAITGAKIQDHCHGQWWVLTLSYVPSRTKRRIKCQSVRILIPTNLPPALYTLDICTIVHLKGG